MEKFTFDDYLEKRYFDQLKFHTLAARKNQKKYTDFQWTLIILSTLTTIMAAMPEKIVLFSRFTVELKYVIVLTSGLVTILTAGLKTFKYEELWLNYRKTAEKLKPHFYLFSMNIGKYGIAGVNKEKEFVENIEGILNKEQSAWLGIKTPADTANQQLLEELQAKLDGLLREEFNTKKNGTDQAGPESPETTAEGNEAEMPGETEAGVENFPVTTDDIVEPQDISATEREETGEPVGETEGSENTLANETDDAADNDTTGEASPEKPPL